MSSEKPSSVVVALSGGLDSAVSAALLKSAGWDVHGLHFLLPADSAVAEQRRKAVRRIAAFLHVPLETVDVQGPFNRQIIDPFVAAYEKGLTPNPCVMCNPLIKFTSLLRFAEQHHIRHIATGHYIRLGKSHETPVVSLLRGRDRHKDQSYFLHRLNQTFLGRSVFPLGEMTKDRVAQTAREMGLPGDFDAESQDICFLSKTDYRRLLEQRGDGLNRRGNIIDIHGRILGEHAGIYQYTIGQRQGLGIASPRPYYVRELKAETNEVVAGRKEDLFSDTAEATQFEWVEGPPLQKKQIAQAQVRYRHRAAPGVLAVIAPDRVRFTFDTPQWAITPGQFLCCYAGDRVLGGGVIGKPAGRSHGQDL